MVHLIDRTLKPDYICKAHTSVAVLDANEIDEAIQIAAAEAEEVDMAEVLDIIQLVRKLSLIEAEGVGFYQSLAEHADDDKIKKLAQLMVRAEQAHKTGFEELAGALQRRTKKPAARIPGDIRQYILALIDHRIFLSPEQASELAKNVGSLDEAVQIAIKFEKENILLLLECSEITGGSTKKIIDKIIQQERKHVIGLKRAREQLLRSGATPRSLEK